eukprot:CAMPEP_0184298106 /NCGR_PEP_ID=MMETSP1049-20130417/8961_1 /TAXON_ID=77928 /ORGANISM="Proteomonas sulcata, Strain CCMP704" /LENGTH=37 /DNA_ID= /DNA_START= /DNA_END= /DNA_ORIENTATION=
MPSPGGSPSDTGARSDGLAASPVLEPTIWKNRCCIKA